MIIVDHPQRSPEWFSARHGVPTASCFDRVLTPTGKPSGQAMSYAALLLAEQITGLSYDEFLSPWVERGEALEPEARAFYEMETGRKTKAVGLILTDDRKVGCSPDALVYGEGEEPEGLLEIKCPAPHTHVEYLLAGDTLPAKYKPQVQGQLLVTGMPWVDFLSYHPDMPPALIRVERDEEYLELLGKEVDHLLLALWTQREILTKRGIKFAD